ncbi:hypothetical protein CC86DRAFT_81102 [Ophiobolus disseminans]|uniref:Heterokaryon incompatibility domain-containing protein n=1 Tax=Ophiobolus disseminans TaxID=1469910 RepID=A0A6A6ZQW3_9PLEO|nr:hypothetical protein CC86DRAFT_81102 [Ophiobolus disseminans]
MASKMNTSFQHSRLNHEKPSIRLVQVLPSLSAKGLVQCRVWHTVITTSYSCVSYTWGQSDPLLDIEINGEGFKVRQNLFDFLRVVREDESRDVSSEAYWIDAICIDQANILERNHQVGQMGQIFSNAICVHIWLGIAPAPMLDVVQAIRRGRSRSSLDWHKVHVNVPLINKHIIKNGYFCRAWVTQEVLLARSVTVRLGTESLSLSELIVGMEYFNLLQREADNLDSAFFQFTLRWRKQFKRENLMALLAQFRDKECEDPRDRIFSLLSLCSDEGRGLKVDYTISLLDLAANVLRECASSLCLCSAILVLQALRIPGFNQKKGYTDTQNHPFLEFDVATLADYFTGSDRFLYSSRRQLPCTYHDAGHGTQNFELGQYYNFFDTCESIMFADLVLAWEFAKSHGTGQVSWGTSGSKLTRQVQGTTTYGQGIEVNRDASRENIYVVRIALWLLAELNTEVAELCIQATRPRRRRRDVPIGRPRIWQAFHVANVDNSTSELPPLKASEYKPTPPILVDGDEYKAFRRPHLRRRSSSMEPPDLLAYVAARRSVSSRRSSFEYSSSSVADVEVEKRKSETLIKSSEGTTTVKASENSRLESIPQARDGGIS